MRNLFAAAAVFGLAATAAAQPLNPYDAPVVTAPAVAEPAPMVPPPPAVPPLAAPPPGYYYPPPGYAPPMWAYPPPPVYYVQPVRRRVRRVCLNGSCQPAAVAAVVEPPAHARLFSVGVRFSGLGVNQQINGQDVLLWGLGGQLRFRTRGRFGLEAAVDILHGHFDAPQPQGGPIQPATNAGPFFHIGPVTRDSYPVSLSALLYIFPNDDARHFNLYFLGGIGVVPTRMGLTDENGNQVTQSFTEYEGHLGVGAELRFRWLAIQADIRGIAMGRDDSGGDAAFYANVDGGPVPKSSVGAQGTLGATLWF